jgi:hypothetical protein
MWGVVSTACVVFSKSANATANLHIACIKNCEKCLLEHHRLVVSKKGGKKKKVNVKDGRF